MKKKTSGIAIKIGAAVAILVAMLASCAVMYYFINKYGVDHIIKSLKDFTDSMGVWGVLVMLLIQVVQVVLAFIPGEPIELCAGALYGTVGGALLCLAGIAIGTFIIFLLVKTLGKDLVLRVIGSDKYSSLGFLKDPAKRDLLIFILMFIPGTPKDVLTYFSPLAGISMWRFVLIAAVARIPSVISSTYVGGNLAEGKYLHSAIVFAVVGIISVAGILLYNKIIEAKNKESHGQKNGQ